MSVLQIKRLPCERFMYMYFTEVIGNDIGVYIKEKSFISTNISLNEK